MICVHLNSVLLITPEGVDGPDQTGHTPDPWMRIEAHTVGGALRQVRHLKPSVLVIDLSEQRTDWVGFDRMLRVMTAVRTRVPRTSIVVLGASDDTDMEQAVRRQGASVYLPVSQDGGRGDARQIVQALYARHGPTKAHGPPASGVPPR